jgi:hypothetical protein
VDAAGIGKESGLRLAIANVKFADSTSTLRVVRETRVTT